MTVSELYPPSLTSFILFYLSIYFVLRARHRDPAHRFHHLIDVAFLNVASLSFKISLPLQLLVAPGPNIIFKRQE